MFGLYTKPRFPNYQWLFNQLPMNQCFGCSKIINPGQDLKSLLKNYAWVKWTTHAGLFWTSTAFYKGQSISAILTRPPQNGVTLYQNGAVPGRSRSFLERARPKIKFGTERPGTRNDQISKKWERAERGRSVEAWLKLSKFTEQRRC